MQKCQWNFDKVLFFYFFEEKSYHYGTEADKNKICGNRLNLEVSIWFHGYIYVDIDAFW